jgi:hypothetical protein
MSPGPYRSHKIVSVTDGEHGTVRLACACGTVATGLGLERARKAHEGHVQVARLRAELEASS